MTVQITLDLPDALFHQFQELSRTARRPINALLIEQLVNTTPSVFVHPKRVQMQKEVAAFESQHVTLWASYPHHFVAFLHGRVIDHDPDEGLLAARIDALYPNQTVLIRQVLPDLPDDLVFRSPRFVPDHA